MTTLASSTRPRRFRRITWIAMITAASLVVLVALLPTILSWGIASMIVRSNLADRIHGEVKAPLVLLGWFSAQRVGGLRIDGAEGAGQIDLDIEVDQGLFGLAMGDDITATIRGSVISATGPNGEYRLLEALKTPQSEAIPETSPSAPTSTGTSIAAPDAPFFGTRKLQLTLVDFSIGDWNADRSAGSIAILSGDVALDGAKAHIDLSAKASSKQSGTTNAAGACTLKGDAVLVTSASGGIDLFKSTLECALELKDARFVTPRGVVEKASLSMSVSKDAEGSIAIDGRGEGAVEGGAASTLAVKLRATECIDASGSVQFDLAKVIANVDLRAMPIAPLTPLLRAVGVDARIDPTLDLGETADILITAAGAGAARLSIDTQRMKLNFAGTVTPDGTSVRDGVLDASMTLRNELVSAMAGIEAKTPLHATLSGKSITWTQAIDGTEAPMKSAAGEFQFELTRPMNLTVPASMTGLASATSVGVQVCTARVSKQAGVDTISAMSTLDATLGVGGQLRLTSSADLDLASMRAAHINLDCSGAIDPSMLAALSKDAVQVGPRGATIKVQVTELAVDPALDSIVSSGTVRVDVGGSLILQSASTQTAVTNIALIAKMPSANALGSLDLSASVDGSNARIVQSFAAIPQRFDDVAQLGLSGTISLQGIDPSLITRFVPAAAESIGVLGRGPIACTLKNDTKNSRLNAEFSVKAANVEASGTAQIAKESIGLQGIRVAATLSAESLAALPLPEGMLFEPGANFTVTVPACELRQSSAGWSLESALTANVVAKNIRVLRAPGLSAPLGVATFDATVSYAMQEERASAKGSATLGGGGTAGAMQFDLAWKKPAEAKLFGGAEGTLSFTKFDLARFEPSFGIQEGMYSGLLGGAGSLSVQFKEQPAASANVTLDFPKTKGSIALAVTGDAAKRRASGTGSVTAEISAEAFGKLAGISNDTTRRVMQPVTASLTIDSFACALDAAMQPVLESGAFALRGALSPVAIEIIGANQTKSIVSIGALALTASATRLAEQVTVKLSSDASGKSSGTLAVDATVRSALSAKPIMDADVRATKFPAATIDALAGTNGALQKYVGDAIDATFLAKGVSQDRGTASASIKSAFASVDAPNLAFGDGFLKVTKEKPLRATFMMNDAVKQELLASINPVFTDVVSPNPAVFTLTSLAWPTDGDRRKFDAAFDLTLGEVRLTNSGPLAFLIGMTGTANKDGMDALVEPLHGTISHGKLTYDNFNLRFGKTATSTWKNSIVFAGDVDLVALYATAITTEVPLADAANWSKQADLLVQGLSASGQEFVKGLKVGVKMSGPLFDRNGKPAKLDVSPTFPDVGKALLDNPAGLIETAGSIFDAFRKK